MDVGNERFVDAVAFWYSSSACPPDALESAITLPALAGDTSMDSASRVVAAAAACGATGNVIAAAVKRLTWLCADTAWPYLHGMKLRTLPRLLQYRSQGYQLPLQTRYLTHVSSIALITIIIEVRGRRGRARAANSGRRRGHFRGWTTNTRMRTAKWRHPCRDRYRDMAKTLGFGGHIAWAETMP